MCNDRLIKQVRQADQDEAADIDDTGMQQGGDRCGRLHDLDQPAMQRQLCGFQDHRQHDHHGGQLQ